ncbi:TRM11 family SAM-dependent methyltransferase [Paenibacillus sp. MBLB4367]|uniref:TRM11 family SAM-dependent methyltransferase n=1 Tax=Paenibacillus sp. MBLB4367 TaxID=3384767 RepID=UPI003907F44C
MIVVKNRQTAGGHHESVVAARETTVKGEWHVRADRVTTYLYTYACHEDETELCALELRTLLGAEPSEGIAESGTAVDPSRSPFVKMRIAVLYEAESLEALCGRVEELDLHGATFKVLFAVGSGIDYDKARAIERAVGLHIRGKADMRSPDKLYGIAVRDGRWLFGECIRSEAVWLKHAKKPQNYSTALSTRMARAVANIAVPDPAGVKAVDPCCGIGTVLVEAMSMGIDIAGYDINPLAVRGARTNLAHFGLPNVVAIGDVRELTGSYDAAILDMPYNLCSKLSPGDQLSMLEGAGRLAGRVVIVTAEPIEEAVGLAGLAIADRCEARKGSFVRQVLVCVRAAR